MFICGHTNLSSGEVFIKKRTLDNYADALYNMKFSISRILFEKYNIDVSEELKTSEKSVTKGNLTIKMNVSKGNQIRMNVFETLIQPSYYIFSSTTTTNHIFTFFSDEIEERSTHFEKPSSSLWIGELKSKLDEKFGNKV